MLIYYRKVFLPFSTSSCKRYGEAVPSGTAANESPASPEPDKTESRII